MNDTELLLWVAEHIIKFELGSNSAKMEYFDDDGYNHTVRFSSDDVDPQSLDMLKGCVAAAVKEMETKQ